MSHDNASQCDCLRHTLQKEERNSVRVTTLFHNEWVSLRKMVAPTKGVKGYVYSHETRCNGMIIAILPFRTRKVLGYYIDQREYLLRNEITPCWDVNKPYLSTFTGGVEHEYTPEQDAVRELYEEAGYKITASDLISLGTCLSTKSSDTTYHLYSVDLTGKKNTKPLGDGSLLEARAKNKWVLEDIIPTTNDPFVSVIYLRLQESFKEV